MSPPDEGDRPHWILLFDSIHFVLAAERVFQQRGVWCDLVPVPRDLSSDCGMVIAFRREDLAAVGDLLADPRIRLRNVYRPSPAGYEEATAQLAGGDSEDESS